jgi:DNA invertase Pin-like site-specific DNA recombinase
MIITEPVAAGCRSSTPGEIQPHHLERSAVVYVRQSSPHQVLEHRESTALRPAERVLVIDQDQGLSGTSAAGREGFQHLLAKVTLNHVGLVLGIEMSRLARSC